MSVNNSATGGPLLPSPRVPVLDTDPTGLTLIQFIQTVFVGISGFPGSLVRPNWQPEPPKEPDLNVNWMSFGIQSITPDANAYEGYIPAADPSDPPVPYLQRNELLQINVSVYGPCAYDNTGLIRDGFQLSQNLTSLKIANMGFAYDEPAQHAPDLVGQRWFDRYVQNIFLRRQIQRTYPILSFVSASGITYTQTTENPDYSKAWGVGE